MLKLFGYLKRAQWVQIALIIALIAGQVHLNLMLPDFMNDITQKLETGGTLSEILYLGGKMLLCALGSGILAVITMFFSARVATTFSRDLRSKVFRKTLSYSQAEIDKFSTASLITRSTNDITQIQQFFAMGLVVMIQAPIMAGWAIVRILGKGWEWTAATGVGVLVIALILSVVIAFALPRFKRLQWLTDNLNRVTREHLLGIRVVHAYNGGQFQERKFEQANEELANTQVVAARAMAILMPGIQLVMMGLTLSIYLIGAQLINAAAGPERITLFSNMIVFSAYGIQVIMAFMMLAFTFIILPRASVAAKRILEILNTPLSLVDGELAGEDSEVAIQFKDVTFQYPGASDAVLEDISFTVKKGQTFAFIGSTGSGKSTLINLIPRLYDVAKGQVLVNGLDVRQYKMSELWNRIGYVSQKAVLFSGTVASNVAFGSNGQSQLTEEGVRRAVAIAQGKDFVEKIGYDGAIAQGGTNVSGGQKQRLSIARAIGREPDIFLFDDSFSALDYKTDRTLRQVLKQETKGATTLIVAQRIGTIKEADQIIVLDEGKMVGIGTHKELLATCPTYQEIAYSQLSKEELADE